MTNEKEKKDPSRRAPLHRYRIYGNALNPKTESTASARLYQPHQQPRRALATTIMKNHQ
jgi:hypothetical protein